ncbi:MAG TPA: type II toxin-antitoxin system VapC family toxin [Desulfobacteraceae bacterium]|nr:type II toxin-antitoxin system VapC family toxin [Desulfobacteraceae bacterium]
MPGKADSLPDTNALLRYLLRDNPVQYEEAERYFDSIRTGGKKALLLESVLVECVYVLTKFYQVPKSEAVEALSALLRYKGIVNDDKDILLDALALFAAENIDLVDCILLAAARHTQIRLFSFDKKLIKLSGRAGKSSPAR